MGLSTMPRGESHLPQLDGLRALAVLAVLVHHATPWFKGFFNLGGAGVQLFFVLSGYLITGILLRARAQVAGQVGASRHVLMAF